MLYPLGIGSETWLVYRAIPHAAAVNPLLRYALYAVLAIYVPGKQALETLLPERTVESQPRCRPGRSSSFSAALHPLSARGLTPSRLIHTLHAHDGAAPEGFLM